MSGATISRRPRSKAEATGALERRSFGAELRAAAGGKKISGYAALFDTRSEDLGGFVEVIAPGAFDAALKRSDIRALYNHDPNIVLGRVRSRTLTVKSDSRGLSFEIDPPDTQVARDLLTTIRRGDVDQASFSFRVGKGGDRWETENGLQIRTIVEVEELFDVSPVTYPAYSDTVVSARARSLAAADAAGGGGGRSKTRLSMAQRRRQIQKADAGGSSPPRSMGQRRRLLEQAEAELAPSPPARSMGGVSFPSSRTHGSGYFADPLASVCGPFTERLRSAPEQVRRDAWLTAVHEAGHAVIAELTGGRSRRCRLQLRIERGLVKGVTGSHEGEHGGDTAVGFLAGVAAERLFSRTPPPPGCWSSDRSKALAELRLPDDIRSSHRLENKVREAKRLLDLHQGTVEAIARELLRTGVMDGAAIRRHLQRG